MLEHKKLIAGFGIREGKAVRLEDGQTCYEENLLTLTCFYGDSGADELFLYDMSESDEDHERTIGLMKEIARLSDIPAILGGRVRRLEDVKKYLYAGAKAAFLDVSLDENVDLMKEAADRFGDDKIYAYLPDCSYLERTKEYAQLGATVMILGDAEITEEKLHAVSDCEETFLVTGCGEDAALFAFALMMENVEGLVGSFDGEENCMDLKQDLKALGIEVDTFESPVSFQQFKLNEAGLIPVITQDYRTGEVLMLAYMNEEAFYETLKTGCMTYYSRSRKSLWRKGETSGHYQYVKSLSLDCDKDTLLAKVNQIGTACHTGARSCFYQNLVKKEYQESNPLKVFEEVFQVILDRKSNPKEGSYTNYLFDKGLDKILKKLGEESTEIVIAAKNPNPEEVKYEISDFLYHMMVLMAYKGVSWEDITRELSNR
ncbi:bifunctional phosphoribosyl-AMP cyclohydrolase/phosphoribosyl-ATP diphosphatase HisIE [Lacrimispora saccharolytica]|uniref:Histidine biosynthesis bifunctional protein HisIE n=1 Tax=Lacrimispora saccharolytica (strain ATCC 35040 / DSM 2544 / NRCC 2533 / WM1) TaxID=610130 RepID=D9R114_LACSW|nr:bifunctional phosphoribosyl-AMP cyclohydrolase/phosphoribosyl-ATP diphosphatase HisIE [Lacrimispora saccharolytica]ADL04561.1 phosphoribosyl-ATP diphosphatase [[Clostridium] saccharolyticum WM1]QRV22028.1 bifunctional phosphoribosyl-AMP cyclohydrolase/phosphoribosyl-ATP diphosphatase HisIE [Lacrimispora saccharolytica]